MNNQVMSIAELLDEDNIDYTTSSAVNGEGKMRHFIDTKAAVDESVVFDVRFIATEEWVGLHTVAVSLKSLSSSKRNQVLQAVALSQSERHLVRFCEVQDMLFAEARWPAIDSEVNREQYEFALHTVLQAAFDLHQALEN